MPTTITARENECRLTLVEQLLVLLGRASAWYTCYAYPHRHGRTAGR